MVYVTLVHFFFCAKKKADKCQCFAIKVLVLQHYQPLTAKSTKYFVLEELGDLRRMLINSRYYSLWQKASRASAKPFSLQLLLSPLAFCDPHHTSRVTSHPHPYLLSHIQS